MAFQITPQQVPAQFLATQAAAGGATQTQQAAGTPATATPAAAGETSRLSPAATQAAAYEKSSKAIDRFTGAFGKLPEDQKKELGGQIGKKFADSTAAYEASHGGKKMTEAQSAELKWSTMASVSAEWAGSKGAGSIPEQPPAGYKAGQLTDSARNMGDLYYGGMEYGKSRLEYINAGGPIGQ